MTMAPQHYHDAGSLTGPRHQNPRTVLEARAGKIKTQILLGGVAIVALFVLPFTIVGSKPVWFLQNLPNLHVGGQLAIIFTLLVGVTLIVLSHATRGFGRSIPVLSLWILSVLLIYVGTGWGQSVAREGGEAVALMLLIIVGLFSCLTLMPAAKWRALGPTPTRRTIVCIAGSLLALCCLIALIWALVSLADSNFFRGGAAGPEAGAVLTVVVAVSGLIMGLIAGILGIVLVNPAAQSGSYKACNLLGSLCLTCLILAVAMMQFLIMFTFVRGGVSVASVVLPTALLAFHICLVPMFVLSAVSEALYEFLLSCSAAMTKTTPGTVPPQPALYTPPPPYTAPPPAPSTDFRKHTR